MGLNVSKARSLLRDLHGKDPDAQARQQLIPASLQTNPTRLHAVGMMAVYLLSDPRSLVAGAPPDWLIDLSETKRGGSTLLFDSRLSDLSRRIVDDVLSQGVTAERLITWLGDREREERLARSSTTST